MARARPGKNLLNFILLNVLLQRSLSLSVFAMWRTKTRTTSTKLKREQSSVLEPKELPSKSDRLAVYRCIQQAVDRQEAFYVTLLDPRCLGINSFFSKTTIAQQPACSIGVRKRQIRYLRLEFLPTVSAALLLELQDVLEATTGEDSDKRDASATATVQKPIACITLLVSNMVLASQGNYDSRVRSILKDVCVQLLVNASSSLATSSSPSSSLDAEDEAAYRSRALYFVTQLEPEAGPGVGLLSDLSERGNNSSSTIDCFELSSYIPKFSVQRSATIQFESIEQAIATLILKEMVERQEKIKSSQKKNVTVRDAVVRGLQITTVGVVVGSLFAVTGGLAAPGLVAAITAFGVHGSVAFATLTTTTALASMFGVVGGGLGAYKMSRRVKGLSEWKIRQETRSFSTLGEETVTLRGLHAHVCVSGWLADKADFQRPFGVQANDPKLPPLEALQRFFCVNDPEKIKDARALVKANAGEESQLWSCLADKYGKSPDNLLPLDRSSEPPILSEDTRSEIRDVLTYHVLPERAAETMQEILETTTMLVQMEAKNQEVLAVSYTSPAQSLNESMETSDFMTGQAVVEGAMVSVNVDGTVANEDLTDGSFDESVIHGEIPLRCDAADVASFASNAAPNVPTAGVRRVSERFFPENIEREEMVDSMNTISMDDTYDLNDHSQIIWDWEATYAGELYTVTWESTFLLKLCRVATTLFLELSGQVSRQILIQSLVGAAVALPSALMTVSGVIDDPYQLISLRSQKAGLELAHCLMTSEEHRPISLVGFSFGARVIFECLLELARHQLIWQDRKAVSDRDTDTSRTMKGRRTIKDSEYIVYKREPASIVEDVVLIGMPRIIENEAWISCREIVAGRLVNCFNRKDWIVAYMINVRCAGGIRKTCGTHPVQNIEGVENFEVSEFAPTHDRYLVSLPQILHKVGYSQPRCHLESAAP
jgi:hypothetical protein